MTVEQLVQIILESRTMEELKEKIAAQKEENLKRSMFFPKRRNNV